MRIVRLVMFTVAFAALVVSMFLSTAEAKPMYKVAIIDSGYSMMPFGLSAFKLCKTGHFDFGPNLPRVGEDELGHGSYVTELIDREAQSKNVCYVIYKVFGVLIQNPEAAINEALELARKERVSAINMSLYTMNYSIKMHNEIKLLTNQGVKVYVAAGNFGDDMNKICRTYPVCLKGINSNMVVVGATDAYGQPATYTNYGAKVTVWQFGDLGQGRGTSFASPRALGQYIKQLGL